MKYTGQNEASINAWKEKYDLPWMKPLTEADFRAAARGEALLTLTPNRKVPFSWYEDCKGKQVLGLAAGGGQQMAVLSALGAACTLLDFSEEQLTADRLVSEREGYAIQLCKGDMTERLPFADESFDYVAGLDTGIYWAFWGEEDTTLRRRLPFNPLKDEALRQELLAEDMALVFSHTLEEQIGGQLKAGFLLKDILEDTNEAGPFFEYNIPTFILTRAVKA